MACKYSCGYRYLLDSISSYSARNKECRKKIGNRIEQFDIQSIIITPVEYGSRFKLHQNSHGDAANTPNSSEICTFQ